MTLSPKKYSINLSVVLFIVLSLLVNGGCSSYVRGRGARTVPGGVRRLAIPIFKNKSMETGIEVYFTNALRNQMTLSQIVSLVEKTDSEAYIEGIVEEIAVQGGGQIRRNQGYPNLPDNTVLNSQQTVSATARIRLVRTSDGVELWSGSFAGSRSYASPLVTLPVINTVNPLYNLSARRQHIESLSNELMAEAHDRMTENF